MDSIYFRKLAWYLLDNKRGHELDQIRDELMLGKVGAARAEAIRAFAQARVSHPALQAKYGRYL